MHRTVSLCNRTALHYRGRVSFAANWNVEDYVLCSDGGLTLATENPLRLKRVNPSAKCLILSSGWWMPQSLEMGGGGALLAETPLDVSL